MSKYSERVKKALDKINCSGVLKVYEYGDCVELIVERWGDICTYRVYNDGSVCER